MPILTAAQSRSSNLAAFTDTLPGKILVGLCATLVVAAAAHVSIPLPFTPVPLTLQPLAVLGVGLALGPVAGFFTMLAYLVEGAAGLPVFSPTGPGGLIQLFGATGGYLLAYPFVAAIAGGVARPLSSRISGFIAASISCTLAIALLFACGAGWLMTVTHLSLRQTWIVAIAPFLPGEAVKIIVAAGIYSTLTRARRIQ
jgi:biotin transport system substrate-specific component